MFQILPHTLRVLTLRSVPAAVGVSLLSISASGCNAAPSKSSASASQKSAAKTSSTQTKRTVVSKKVAEKKMRVYVGSYAKKDSNGIHVFELDAAGKLTSIGGVAGVENPSFLALHPSGKFLYAASETYGPNGGSVAAFSVDEKTGIPAFLNQESSKGQGPCYVAVSKNGHHILAANYGSGSIASLPIGTDGKVGAATTSIQHQGASKANTGRQKEVHAHSINLDGNNRFAVAADLGADKLFVYRFDEDTGTLTPNEPAASATVPGAGPRHFAFHPGGRFAFAINELNSSVVSYAYDAQKGTLTPIQTLSSLPQGVSLEGNSPSEIAVHPSGKWVYGANRGHDSIALYSVDVDKGTLTYKGEVPSGGKSPRHFGIDPTGKFLIAAHQESGTLTVFRIDPKTGALASTGQTVEVPKAVCVKYLQVPVS